MLTLTVELKGLDEALGSLDRIKSRVRNLEPELQDVGEYLVNFLSRDVFDTEGSTYGSPWAPLSEKYALYKLKKYGGAGLLVASGRMKNSWKLYTASDYLIVRNEATSEDGSYYARFHQDGTSKMPQRTLLKFDYTRSKIIKDKIVYSLNRRIKDAI